MSQQEQHLTIEDLSVFLDTQLSPEKQAAYSAHLQGCEQCQKELTGLRQTVTLLRALPQPSLPRSFVLPTTPVVQSVGAQRDTLTLITKIGPRSSSTRTRTAVNTALRVVSALAAVIGIVFILSGLLSSLLFGSAQPTASQFNAMSKNDPSVVRNADTTAHQQAQDKDNAGTPAVTSTQPDSKHAQAAQGSNAAHEAQTTAPGTFLWPQFLFFDLNTMGGRLGLGILLFVAGSMGIRFFSRKKSRAG